MAATARRAAHERLLNGCMIHSELISHLEHASAGATRAEGLARRICTLLK